MLLRAIGFCVAFCALRAPSAFAAKLSEIEATQVSKLLGSFQNGCSATAGPAADAIAYVQNLSVTLQAIVEDENCKSVSGAINQLNSIEKQTESLLPYIHNSLLSDDEKRIQNLEAQKQTLITLIAQEENPDQLFQLKTNLYDTQVALAGYQSESGQNLWEEQQKRKALAAQLLVNSTKTITTQLLSNQKCWINKPNVMQNIVGLGAAVAGSAAILTGNAPAALLVGAGAQVVSTVIDYFKDLAEAKKLATFNVSLHATALMCAMEKMNDVFCSAVDGKKALKVITTNATQKPTDPVWSGLSILERDIPTFVIWLEKIRNGGEPSSSADGSKIGEILIREARVRAAKQIALGMNASFKQIYDQTTGDEARFTVLRNYVLSTYYTFCPTNSNGSLNPLCEQKPLRYITYFLLGINTTDYAQILNKYPNLDFSSFSLDLAYEFGLGNFQFDTILTNFLAWHSDTEKAIEIEKKLALNADLDSSFQSDALRPSGLYPSPIAAFKNTLRFIDWVLEQDLREPGTFFTPASRTLAQKVKAALETTISQIELVNNEGTTPEKAKEIIVEATNLTIGTAYFRNRVQNIVKDQLNNLVRNPGLVPEDLSFQILAANDYISELKKYYPSTSSGTEMLDQISSSMSIMRFTMEPFQALFRDQIKESLADLQAQEKEFGAGMDNPARRMRTRMCFYLLGTGVWNENYASCKGLQIESIIGLKSVAFSKDLYKKPIDERACILKNFMRKVKVLERQSEIAPKERSRQVPRTFMENYIQKTMLLRSLRRVSQ